MSSSGFETLISTVTHTLPIPELINSIKHSFRECEFNEVQNILVDRENNMKIEMENLVRDRDVIKEEVRLLERTQGLTDLEKMKLEEKLQMSERKCEELVEKITRLVEEKRVSGDREKRAEERYSKVCAENTKMANEKNKLIFELNEKINELKNKNMENERLVGVYQGKLKAANQSVEDLGRRQMEADRVVEDLKRQNAEAIEKVEDLRRKKLESEKEAELYKSQLSPRIMKVEEVLARILNVKVEDLAKLVDAMEKSVGAKEENVDLLDVKGEKNGDAENGVGISRVVPSTSNSDGSGKIGPSKKDCRNYVQSLLKDCSNMVQNPPEAQSDATDKDNELDGLQGSGQHASGVRLDNRDIIEISDSDDETNPSIAAYSQSKKQNITDCRKDSLRNTSTKRKRIIYESDEDILPNTWKNNLVPNSTYDRIGCEQKVEEVLCDTQTPLQKLNGLNEGSCSDSEDESCSDSCIDGLIARAKSKKLGKKWFLQVDMLKDFQEDAELCMNAVCALYRQKIFARKPTKHSNLSKSAGSSPDDLMSECALAEYLIDGDRELRLRKSVSEVKKQQPEVLSRCQSLATSYIEKLYEIYCSAKDPFFPQK